MEHILQFAINIDDETIKQRIEKSAERAVVAELKKSLSDKIFSRWSSNGFTDAAEAIIKEFLNEHKDEIIKQSVDIVAESIKRSKKYKEALANIVEELK